MMSNGYEYFMDNSFSGEDETTVSRYQMCVMKLLGLIDPQDTAVASEPRHIEGEVC